MSGGRTVAFRGRGRPGRRRDPTAPAWCSTTRPGRRTGPRPAARTHAGRRAAAAPGLRGGRPALLGATDVEAAYWFVSAKGGFKRDEFRLDAATEARFREVVGHIVDSIDEGWFPAVPGDAEHVLRFQRQLPVLQLRRGVPGGPRRAVRRQARRAGVRGVPRARSTTRTRNDRGHARRRGRRAAGSPPTVSTSCCSSRPAPGTGKTKQLVDRVVALVLDRAASRCARSRRSRSPRPRRASSGPASARRSSGWSTTPRCPPTGGTGAEAALVDLDGCRDRHGPQLRPADPGRAPGGGRAAAARRGARRGREPARASGGAGRRTSTGCSPTCGSTR